MLTEETAEALVEKIDPVDRAKREAAFVEAVRAVHAVVEARDAAAQALTGFADSFVVGDAQGDYSSFDELLEQPLGKTLSWYHPETFALWARIGAAREFLAEDGAGSGFEFDLLLTLELPALRDAFAEWILADGDPPDAPVVAELFDVLDQRRRPSVEAREPEQVQSELRSALAEPATDAPLAATAPPTITVSGDEALDAMVNLLRCERRLGDIGERFHCKCASEMNDGIAELWTLLFGPIVLDVELGELAPLYALAEERAKHGRAQPRRSRD